MHTYKGTPSAKDTIEALGVPHTEIDLILIDGLSCGFDALLRGGERVAVYTTFERIDISPLNRLRPEPLRETRFILDAHLGKLARYLRMLGFDATYGNDVRDVVIVQRSRDDGRVILTRDRGIVKHGDVTHGYWLRLTDPVEQLREVVEALDLAGRIRPFTRCMACNAELERALLEEVRGQVPEDVAERCNTFTRCPRCERVYWKGSHFERMERLIASIDESGAAG